MPSVELHSCLVFWLQAGRIGLVWEALGLKSTELNFLRLSYWLSKLESVSSTDSNGRVFRASL